VDIEAYRQRVREDLESVVLTFNISYAKWVKETGCKANFGWRYTSGGEKALAIESITLPVYSNEDAKAEQASVAEEILSKSPTQTVSKS
jgi:hypothetical protein